MVSKFRVKNGATAEYGTTNGTRVRCFERGFVVEGELLGGWVSFQREGVEYCMQIGSGIQFA